MVWLLSDLDSSLESRRIAVGDIIEVPAVLFGYEMAPRPEILSDIDFVDLFEFVGGGGIPVKIAVLREGSTAIIDAYVSETELSERKIRGYLFWEPYWYPNYIGKEGYKPEIYAKVTDVAVISSIRNGDSSKTVFIHDTHRESFEELAQVSPAGSQLQYRCIRLEVIPR